MDEIGSVLKPLRRNGSVLPYKSNHTHFMTVSDVFLYAELTPADKIAFAKSFELCQKIFGRTNCWCLRESSHPAFSGFALDTSHHKTIRYKGADARPLILAMSGQFQPDESHVAIRKSICNSPHCLNPSHYYWGTKAEVALEGQRKKKNGLTPEIICALQEGRKQGKRVLDLSRQYKVPYHTARRICAGETYETQNEIKKELPVDEFWGITNTICETLVARYPREERDYRLSIHVANELECPWYRRGFPGHKGNFGLMGECLDCLEEIKNGRCAVDVTNFDLQWYWQVKRFWEQVEIRGEDECWPWKGSTRRNNCESIAYFPSPFHSGKTQSASRVAFWLGRGYTGKYKVFTRPECASFCCNPKHLTIREFKDMLPPSKLGEIKLNHGNVFEYYRDRKAVSKEQPGAAQ